MLPYETAGSVVVDVWTYGAYSAGELPVCGGGMAGYAMGATGAGGRVLAMAPLPSARSGEAERAVRELWGVCRCG